MQRILRDLIKILVLMVFIGLLLVYFDESNWVIVQMMGIAMFLAGGTHLTRRILLHKLDLQGIAMQAVTEKNVPAAIIFASVVLWCISLMLIPVLVLK